MEHTQNKTENLNAQHQNINPNGIFHNKNRQFLFPTGCKICETINNEFMKNFIIQKKFVTNSFERIE